MPKSKESKRPDPPMLMKDWEPQEATIVRRVWARGQGHGNSAMLHEDGSMCVVGQYLMLCGVSAKALRGCSYPWDLDTLPYKARWLNHIPTVIAVSVTNDTTKLHDQAREGKLKMLFSRFNVHLVFVD